VAQVSIGLSSNLGLGVSWFSKRIGLLRQEIRELLGHELAEIDKLVQEMLGLAGAES